VDCFPSLVTTESSDIFSGHNAATGSSGMDFQDGPVLQFCDQYFTVFPVDNFVTDICHA
jgi:hypothetical protein